jgi:hypothetical protein
LNIFKAFHVSSIAINPDEGAVIKIGFYKSMVYEEFGFGIQHFGLPSQNIQLLCTLPDDCVDMRRK